MEETTSQIACPECKFPILTSFHFCPECGKKFSDPPFNWSVGKRLGLYAMALLLPPLGLWPGIKLLMKADRKGQMVGLIAIALTVISIIVTVWLTIAFIDSQAKQIQSQMGQFQNLGY